MSRSSLRAYILSTDSKIFEGLSSASGTTEHPTLYFFWTDFFHFGVREVEHVKIVVLFLLTLIFCVLLGDLVTYL